MADASLYATPVNAPVSIRINGRDIRQLGVELTELPNILLPPIVERQQVIDGYSGARDFGATYGVWNFNIVGQFRGLTHFDLADKRTKFLRWIDMQQHEAAEWLVSQYGVEALRLELAGHRWFYTEGTAATTAGDATVTGTGTYWLSHVKPGAEFRITGDPASGGLSSRYTVLRVDSNTSMELTTNAAITIATTTYQVERKRYLLVNYNGTSDVGSIGPGMRTTVMPITIGFRTVYPYWVGDEFVQETASASNFLILRGIGTAPHGPTYQLVGDATNPEVCACELAFNGRFDGDTVARTTTNKADVTGTLTEAIRHVAGKLSEAIPLFSDGSRDRGDVLYFYSKTDESDPGASEAPVFGSSNRINYNQGTISFWVNTAWDGDDGVLHDLFKSFADASNQVYIYKTADDDLSVAINDATVLTYAVTGANWDAGNWHWVAIRWNTRTAADGDMDASEYFELFLDAVAEVASSTSNPTEATEVAQQSFIGCSSTAGANSMDGLIDDFAIWDRVLTDAELTTIYNSGAGATADNVSNGLITYINMDGSGALTEETNAGLGSQSSVTMNATSYTQGTQTLNMTKNASDVFLTGDRVIVWSSGATNKYDDIVASSTSTTVVLTTGGALTLTDTIHVSKNLLANGEFEHTNAADYWTAGDGASTLATETTIIKKDSQSLKITNGDATQAFARQTVVTAAGNDFVLRGWQYGPTTVNGASQLVDIDGVPALGITATQAGISAATWMFVEGCFEAADASTTVDLGTGSVTNTEIGYWDNVKLLPNLVNDGGIESWTGDTPDNWNQSGESVGVRDIFESSGHGNQIHSGAKCVQLTATSNNGTAFGLESLAITLTVGWHYEVSVWYYYPTRTAGNIYASIWNTSDGHKYLGGSVISTTNAGWTRISSIIKPTAATHSLLLKMGSETTAGTVYFDDVSIVHRPDLDAEADVLNESFRYLPTRQDKGVYIRGGDTLHYTSVPVNPDQFSFIARIEPKFTPSASVDGNDNTIFDVYWNSGDRIRLFFDQSDQDWVLGITSDAGAENTTIRTTDAQEFAIDDILEISGWYEPAGYDIEGTTYYGKLFVNGNEVGSVTATVTAPNPDTNALASLAVGGLYSSADVSTEAANVVIDELVLYNMSITDDDIKSAYANGDPILNMNATWSYSGTLAAGDILTLHSSTGESELYDASAGTETNAGSSLSGRHPGVRGDELERQVIYLPAAIDRFRTISRAHYR